MNSILLIAPSFHFYYKSMISVLKSLGFSVDYFEDEMKIKSTDMIKSKFSKSYLQMKFNHYFDCQINNRLGKQYDYIILIFGGRYFLPNHIQKLRQAFKKAKLIYYAWDSISNFPKIKDFYFLFDSFFSFDPLDCQTYSFTFLPLFYCKTFIPPQATNDVCSLMTFGRNKSSNIKTVIAALPENLKISIHLIMENHLVYGYNKLKNPAIFKGIPKNYISFKPFSREEADNLYSSSSVIIDCPLENQRGLTIRTFEALAMHRKLITTNTNICDYSFFSKNNIYVLKKGSKEKIPLLFFKTDFDNNYCLSSKYSILNFLNQLLK